MNNKKKKKKVFLVTFSKSPKMFCRLYTAYNTPPVTLVNLHNAVRVCSNFK